MTPATTPTSTAPAAHRAAAARPGRETRLDIDALLDDPDRRVIVCCGSGGVGKTTTAAALALRAAERGRSTVVLTIDPARRLAQSLGLTELDNMPRPVAGVDTARGGSLDAMMLDMKRTFDDVVEAHASPEKARQIFQNPFYQSLSSSFAGTQEYMAMEKLGQLREGRRPDGAAAWDLIVVDTPPSRSALDFLDAPHRLGSFLDSRFLKLLMAPAKASGKAYLKVMSVVAGGIAGMMNRILGAQVITDIQTFVAAFDTMFGGFRQRAEHTYSLLGGSETAFVVVAAPEADAVREAAYFVERLRADAMPLAGIVVNRVTLNPLPQLTAADAAAAAAEAGSPAREVLLVHARRAHRSESEARVVQRLTRLHPRVPTVVVPARPVDVTDLDGLRDIGDELASGPAVPAGAAAR